MKRFPLLPRLALVLAVVYACSDSTAPANSLRPPEKSTLGLRGDPPPPPVDAVIFVSVSSSHPVSGQFTGTYFDNGTSIASTVAAAEVGDDALAFSGTAWLRLDNTQLAGLFTSASANARFQRTDQKLAGHGTLVIDGVTIQIVEVTEFLPFACNVPGEPCASIKFKATRSDDPLGLEEHTGTATAFNREFCTLYTGDGTSFFCRGID